MSVNEQTLDNQYNDMLYDANGEAIKKKRGRKPKSYHIQKKMDVQRQKEQLQIEEEIKKNEEEGSTAQPDENGNPRSQEYK